MQTWKKLVAVMSSVVMAVSFMPLPAFAQGEDAELAPAVVPDGVFSAAETAPDELAVEALPVPTTEHYKWYTDNPDASVFTLGGGAYAASVELVAFAKLVNGTAPATVATGAVDFAGKVVQISDSVTASINLGDATDAKWTPIGDEAHQFKGTFNGKGKTVDYFAVSGTGRAAYLGLFGYVGAGGSVNNVTVGSNSSISVSRAKSSSDVIHHVAGVVGYCGGTMSYCTNNAKVTVSSAVVQTATNPQPVKAVGGVAGECVFNMADCRNGASGAISVSQTSDPVSSVNNSALVYFVGGVVGVLGDSSRIGNSTAAVPAESAKHGSISECANEAQLTINTPSVAGKDRFGATTSARSACVGGVVGYSQGSVSKCVNGLATAAKGSAVGYLRGEHASAAGGIVGSLRGAIGNDNPTQRTNSDDGLASTEADHDALVASECVNYGDVYALNAAGGIVGHAGTYTTITACKNANKNAGQGTTFVVATRWNKPAPAGIVGSSSGTVSYCANFGTVSSGTWSNESQRTIKGATGYYTAGITGMLSYYSKENETTKVIERISPMPEVYGCYNVGSIVVQAGYRERGIVGENGGFVHDNVLLKGVVNGDEIAYEGEDANGTTERNYLLDLTAASESQTTINSRRSAVRVLNGWSNADEWAKYWWVESTAGATTQELNYGYPVLDGNPVADNPQANPVSYASRTSLTSGFTAVKASDAAYTGGTGGNAAVPQVTVTETSSGKVLVQNVDFYVVPDTGNAGSELGAHSAKVVGVGAYKGELAMTGTYDIVKGKLSECSVSIEGVIFNYEGQFPAMSAITVKTAGGTEIARGEYELVSMVKDNVTYTDEAGNRPVNRGNYTVTLRVTAGSTHFETDTGNTVTGTFRISPADIVRYVDWDGVTISWKGTSYPWKNSDQEANKSNPTTVLPYNNGSAVTPSVTGLKLTLNGHDLVEGTDYRLVYGNENCGEGDTISHLDKVKGVAYGSSPAVMAVRYVSGGNFTNFQNMYFKIVDSRQKPSPIATNKMHRLYNPYSGEHFYTASDSEKNNLVSVGWSYEGIGWNAPTTGTDVHRLYNRWTGDHHFTTSTSERDTCIAAGWTYEGVGWKSGGSVKVYREYNPYASAFYHNYTANASEHANLIVVGWHDEGVGWYGS